jgi:DNA-binding transcriptional LysR family regulator
MHMHGRLSFESLKIFCDVARFRSFSKAAAANGVTQSAASQVVHHLEERLGVQLINRSTRPLQLTSLGRTYYEGCQGLVEQYLELEASIRNTQEELAATVQVAAIYSVGLGDMGQYIERFKAMQPNTTIHIEYLHPDRVVEKVEEGTADIGLVSFPRKSRLLEALPWRDEAMVLACAPNHPLAQAKSIKPAALENVPFIGFDRNLTIRREIDRFLRDHNASVNVVLEFDNIENIKKAVEISAGVSLLPEPTLRREVRDGTLVSRPIANGRLVRPLGIVHHRHRKLSPSALRFIDLLRHPDAHGLQTEPGTKTAGTRNGSARSRKQKSHLASV